MASGTQGNCSHAPSSALLSLLFLLLYLGPQQKNGAVHFQNRSPDFPVTPVWVLFEDLLKYLYATSISIQVGNEDEPTEIPSESLNRAEYSMNLLKKEE